MGSGNGSLLRWAPALLTLAATLLLVGCSASAAEPSRQYIPFAPRRSAVTEYLVATPTPTPIRLPTATPTPTTATLRLASYSTRRSEGSTYQYAYVKLEHAGGPPVYNVQVTATYRNAARAITGVVTRYLNLSMLRGGEFGTVELVTEAGSDSVTVDFGWQGSGTAYPTYIHDGLDIAELNTYRTTYSVYVVGSLTNRTGRPLQSAKLDVGLYDATGATIIGSDYTYPFPYGDIQPNAKANFSVSFSNFDGNIPSNATYSVRAEGYVLP